MKKPDIVMLTIYLKCSYYCRYLRPVRQVQTHTTYPTHTDIHTLSKPWTTRSEMFALLITESLLRFLSGSRYKRCFRLSFFVASCLKYRIIALLAGVWGTWLKMCPKSLHLAPISILKGMLIGNLPYLLQKDLLLIDVGHLILSTVLR